MAEKSDKTPRTRYSIAGRLYFAVGIMGLLIFLELLTLRFAMGKLSAVRAFVGGESLWSKAQKNAVFSLQRYGTTHDEFDYRQFEEFLAVPLGDHDARIELMKPNPDLAVVRAGFLRGKIHPADVNPMIDLLQRFYWVKELDRAIKVWAAADGQLSALIDAGHEFHEAVRRHDEKSAATVLDRVKTINERLTELEEDFSAALGDGSRFLENVVLSLLTLAVVMVESIGLTLAILTARAISRGLGSLKAAADDIGSGRFEPASLPRSHDEIGDLAESLARMGLLLKKSYGELEARVRERTADLAHLASENARLYDDASRALHRRDEFLSLASHELKTPITSMLLQAQLLLQRAETQTSPEQVKRFGGFIERQLLRLNELVEEMLDTSRIDLSKLALRLEPVDLSELAHEVCRQFGPQYKQANTPLVSEIEPAITGRYDGHRLEQVIANLLSNALKYAPRKPVALKLRRMGDFAELSVCDQGPGVAAEDRERIFGRFERGVDPERISGLGIGLYIARAIAVAHGGSIEVLDAPEGGACFLVKLPLEKHA
jgi:signal transduction histidine kinase